MSQHIVQFYGIDAFLHRRVSEFLCCAYAAGNSGIILSAKQHQDAIGKRLRPEQPSGYPWFFDPARVAAARNSQAISDPSGAGWPNQKSFQEIFGDAISQSSENGILLLRLFGEMAALFCAMGKAGSPSDPQRLPGASEATPAPESTLAAAAAGLPWYDRRSADGGAARSPNPEKILVDSNQLSRTIDVLQQNTKALETEIARRKEVEKELDRLIARQGRMMEEERKRIARELHDELGALLTGISAYMSVALTRAENEGKAPDQELVVASNLADLAVETVRKVVTDLRPSVLDHLGVWSAIEWYACQVQERTNLKCECRIDAATQQTTVEPELSIALFRIVQEAMTNVARHADASRVSVRATRDGDTIVVEIEDNGIGIETERLLNRESFGVAGMYERARQFGCDIKIAGVAGHGTIVALRIRLNRNAAQRDQGVVTNPAVYPVRRTVGPRPADQTARREAGLN